LGRSFVRVGLVSGGKLSMEGIKQALNLMAESGQLKSAPSGPEKYGDPSYQRKLRQRSQRDKEDGATLEICNRPFGI